MEVLRLCRDEDTTLDDLADVLAHDAALSARLLRFANSSLYNLGSEVSTLQRATLVLGMKTVQLMSLTFSLAPSLPREGPSGFDYGAFWRRSLVRAVAGRSLATLVGTMTEDEAFLCGLLGEVGQIVLTQCMAEPYAEILEACGDRWPSAEVELETLGFDNLDVAAALLEHWGLPELLIQAMAGMRGPVEGASELPDMLVRTCNVIHVACLLTEFLTGDGDRALLTRIEEDAQRLFDLPPAVIDRLIESLEPGLRETSEMLSMDLPAGKTPAEVLAEARGEHMERSLGRTPIANRKTTFDPALLERIESEPSLRTSSDGGWGNQAALHAVLASEVERRTGNDAFQLLGLLCIQADDLAAEHGSIGDALCTVVRSGDLLLEATDGTFVVVVHTASPFGLKTLAERLRRGTAKASGKTVTIGGLCLDSVLRPTDGEALHAAAMHLLRKARSRGRDHCLVHGTPFQAAAA